MRKILFILFLLTSFTAIAQPLTPSFIGVRTKPILTPATTYATWNPTYSDGLWSLSAGNTVATKVASSNGLIIATIGASTTGKSSGTYSWEITITASVGGGNRDIGVISTLSPASFTTWLGNQTATTGWGYYSTNGGFTGALFNNGSITNNYFSLDYAVGDVITFLLDAGANTLKLKKNGTLITPTLILSGGNYFPAASSNSMVYTANFGQTPLLYPDAGYNAGYY